MQSDIMIIPSHRIDRVKWNECVQRSANGLIYASTDYLDHLADNWTGIVINDYKAVAPVAWRKKYGIRYAYDVPFVQQLGIFSREQVIPFNIVSPALFSICSYGDYPFNFANKFDGATVKTNFILPLNRPYVDLAKAFSSDAVQNIKRSETFGLSYLGATVDEAVDIYYKLYGSRVSHVSSLEFGQFKAFCHLPDAQHRVVVRKVVGNDHEIFSIALLLKDNGRLYNMMNSTLTGGKSREANYYLLSSIWKEFQQQDLIFDFEGSDIPGIRDFYKKFGAVDQPYYSMHFNHLPWPLKWIKK